MSQQPEIRLLVGAEIRALDNGEQGFEGRLVPYGVWAPIGGTFEERIAPGCFAKSIKEAAGNLPLMAIHDRAKFPVGKSVDWDDKPDALYGRWAMAPTDQAREAYGLVQGGFLRGLSVVFIPIPAEQDVETRAAPQLTRITRRQARLVEASLVPTPTWAEAVVTVTRSSVAPPGGPLTPYLNAWQEWRSRIG